MKCLGLYSWLLNDGHKCQNAIVSTLNSESHHTFHDLDLRYDYIGSNQENVMTLSKLTGLQHLRVHALEELENADEVVKVLESLTQLKYYFGSMNQKVIG